MLPWKDVHVVKEICCRTVCVAHMKNMWAYNIMSLYAQNKAWENAHETVKQIAGNEGVGALNV